MTKQEYFGGYWKCIDKQSLDDVVKKLTYLYHTKFVCPALKNVFRAFELCDYNNLKVIMLGQDPYPQKDVATGLAFANRTDTKELSPSLEVLKESVIDFEVPHNLITFAPDLEDWAKQGVLLLNSALTVELGRIGSHTMLWRPFISKFLEGLSEWNPGLIYVLFGKQAQSFEPYIQKNNYVIKVPHPAFCARTHSKLPHSLFLQINQKCREFWNTEIQWYKEETYK